MFNTDIAPRGYRNLRFINSFVNAYLNEEKALTDSFDNLVFMTFKNNEEAVEQAERLSSCWKTRLL